MKKRSITKLEGVLRRIKVHLTRIYGGMIKRVVVYGSFAKDEADEESDVDIAVVVADKVNLGKAEKSRDELLSQILMEKSELVTVFVIPESKFNTYKSPLIQNIKEDGFTI
jgi:predicted nucleotidyltransferase